jgi:hypothetical protein
MKYKTFYIWWVFVLLLLTGTFWVGHEGYISEIWMKDATYLTTLMSGVLIYCMALLGNVSWHISRKTINTNTSKLIGRVWFLSEIEMGMAILGTSIGLILLFDISAAPIAGDPMALQAMLTGLWSTLGTAFYPNALGLFASLMLKVAVYFIAEDVAAHEE